MSRMLRGQGHSEAQGECKEQMLGFHRLFILSANSEFQR
jgi:hypothetical protein